MGGFQKCKSQENLPSGCTDWHQICYTSADSCGNGHRLKIISPPIPQGAFWGVLGGHKMQKVWKIYQTAGPIGTKFGKHLQIHLAMDIMLKTISHSIPKGEIWGFRWSKMQKSGKSTKRLDRLAPNLVHVCGFIWEWT